MITVKAPLVPLTARIQQFSITHTCNLPLHNHTNRNRRPPFSSKSRTPTYNPPSHQQEQIQCATGQLPGPNIPIPQHVAEEALAGAMAADPTGGFEWKMLAAAVRRAKLTLKDLV